MKKLALIAMMAAAVTSFGATLPIDTLELRLGGKLDFNNPQGKVDWLIESGLGYFVFDNIEFGPIVDWGYTGNGNDMGLGLGGFGEANLDLDSFIMPYVAMRLQYCFGQYYRNTSEHNYVLWEPAVGSKFFLSESVAIYLELYFDLASEKAFVWGEDAKNNDIGLKTGVRCYF